MASTVEVLERAVKRLEKGWIRGRLIQRKVDDVIEVCAIGSLLSPSDYKMAEKGRGKVTACRAVHFVAEAIAEQDRHARLNLNLHRGRTLNEIHHNEQGVVIQWNDSTGRKKAHVIAVFRRAIELAKEQDQLRAAKKAGLKAGAIATEEQLSTAGD